MLTRRMIASLYFVQVQKRLLRNQNQMEWNDSALHLHQSKLCEIQWKPNQFQGELQFTPIQSNSNPIKQDKENQKPRNTKLEQTRSNSTNSKIQVNHIQSLLSKCRIHLRYMWHTFWIHVRYISHAFHTHFQTHVRYISDTFQIHFQSISYTFHIQIQIQLNIKSKAFPNRVTSKPNQTQLKSSPIEASVIKAIQLFVCYCFAMILQVYCYCIAIVLLLYSYCIAIQLLLYSCCVTIVLLLSCYCVDIVLLLFCSCTAIVWILHCYCIAIVLLLYFSCIAIVLLLYFCCISVVFLF